MPNMEAKLKIEDEELKKAKELVQLLERANGLILSLKTVKLKS